MKKSLHFVLLAAVTLFVVVLSAMRPQAARADDSTPPPPDPAATEAPPTDPPSTDPTAESTSIPDVLSQTPDGTQVVVLNSDGTVEPLATQAAASIITTGDPIWCPDGAAPVAGSGGCTSSYANLFALINDINTSAISQPASNGTIWITDGTDASASTITIDGSSLTTWTNYSLTVHGGWDGSSGGTIVGASTLNTNLQVLNWNNDVTLNDLIFNNSGGPDSIEIDTSGNVALNNVEASNNSGGSGAWIAGGDVTVQNSRFRNNDNNGLEVYSNGAVTLTGVYANLNSGSGAQVEADNNVTVTGSTFNSNGIHGLDAYSDSGDISVSNTDAQYNSESGLVLFANDGNVSVNGGGFDANGAYGIDVGDSGYAYGNITLSNVIASANYFDGAYLFTEGGGVTVMNSVFADNYISGYGLYVDADGNIVLTNVTSVWNDYGGVQLTTPGNVTVSNSVFNRNDGPGMDVGYSLSTIGGNVTLANVEASGNNGDGFQVYADGNLTVNGGTFNNNDGYGIYLPYAGGAVSLSNVQANGNTGDAGAYLDNSSGSGNLTLTSSSFDYNGNYGLSVYSAGAVTLTGVTANGNADSGAGINNAYGSGSVSVTNSQFNNNHNNDGLYVSSAGNLTLTNVLANFNAGDGTYIDTSGAVSINSSRFNVNGINGLTASAGGNISLNNVSAGANRNYGAELLAGGTITDSGTNSFNNNGSVGTDCFGGVQVNGGTATLDNCQSADTRVWFTSGGTLYSYADINSAMTAIAGGLPPDGGAVHIDSALTPYLDDVNIDGTDPFLGQITQLLGGGSGSTLVAGNLQFYDLANGFTLSGLTFSEYVEGWDNTGVVSLTNVNAASLETSSNGCDNGAGIDICYNDGSIALNGVNASGSRYGSGAYLDNSGSSSYSPINISNSTFSGNDDFGVQAYAYGPITLSNVTGTFNFGYMGAYLYNEYGSSNEAQNVQVNNSTLSYNADDHGLNVYSYGNITLTNVTANGNYYDGAYLEADGATGNISVTGSSFSYNYNEDGSYYAGLEVYNYGNGNITLSGVTANGNYYNNAYLENDASTGNVSVSNSTFNYAYDSYGLEVFNYSDGDITLNGVTAINNWDIGAYLETDGSTGNVSVSNSTFNYSQDDFGLEVYTYADGNISLSNVTANGNLYGGAYLYNDGNTGNVSVLNSTFNNSVDASYSGDYYNGLTVSNYATGDVTVTNTTANNNGDLGAYIYNDDGNVTVDPSAFNFNGTLGLWISTSGDITLDHVTVQSSNAQGAVLAAGGDVTVNCSKFKNNLGYGLASVSAALTLNQVTFGGNSAGDYTTSGTVTVNPDDCNPGGAGPGIPPLPLNAVPVTGGEGVGLDCALYRGTVLVLPNGDQVLLPCPIRDEGALKHQAQGDLPGPLDAKFGFLSSMDAEVTRDGQLVSTLDTIMTVDFVIPAGQGSAHLAILHWNGTQWEELNGVATGDGFFEAQTNLTGIFVLASK